MEQQCGLRCILRVGGVGRLVAGGAHRVAGPAGCAGVPGIAQQVQRFGGVLLRVQQHPHAQGGVQLLPAGLAAQVRHPVVIVRAFLLALGNVPQQRVQTVAARLLLPVPAQQAAADLVAFGLDLKCSLQCFVLHNGLLFSSCAEKAEVACAFLRLLSAFFYSMN